MHDRTDRTVSATALGRLGDLIIAEPTVVTVIIINTLALSLWRAPSVVSGSMWKVDYACVVFFLVESVIKSRRLGWRGYLSDGWNRFDFLVVVLSLPVLVTPLVPIHGVGVLTLLRMGRLFRLLRLLRFIPNREHLSRGIGRALRASVGVFLALVLLNVALAVGATHLFGDFAPEHFDNPLRSSYTLFRVFTIEGWYEIPDQIAASADSPIWEFVARAYFLGSVLVGGILGLSLANAVFVDEMTMDNTATLETRVEELAAEIRDLRKLLERQARG